MSYRDALPPYHQPIRFPTLTTTRRLSLFHYRHSSLHTVKFFCSAPDAMRMHTPRSPRPDIRLTTDATAFLVNFLKLSQQKGHTEGKSKFGSEADGITSEARGGEGEFFSNARHCPARMRHQRNEQKQKTVDGWKNNKGGEIS